MKQSNTATPTEPKQAQNAYLSSINCAFACFCFASTCLEYVLSGLLKPLPADLIDSLLIDYKKPKDSIDVIKR